MAKARANNQDLQIDVVSKDEMQQTLSTSRRGRGGRTSRWEPVREALDNVGDSEAVKLSLHKSEVQGFRQYVSKHMPGQVKVVSSMVGGETDRYHVFVTRAQAKASKKR